ncbi:hypothetical protein Tco_0865414, partial [Tanacetum coccineum]
MHGRGAPERLEKQTVVSFDQKYMGNNTLFQDYKSSGKSSVFSDMRIGEQNEELGKLDKKIMRPKLEMRDIAIGYNKEIISMGQFSELTDFHSMKLSIVLFISAEMSFTREGTGRGNFHSGFRSFVTKGKVVTTMMLLSKSQKGFSYHLENKEVVVLEKNDDNDDGEKEDEEEE